MINELHNLIATKYISSVFYLEEKNVKDFPKTLIKTQGKALILKLDEDKKILSFFKDVEGAKSLADYVVFIESENKIFAFVIELSKRHPKFYQKESTVLFIQYIEKTAKRIYKKNQAFVYKYVLILQDFKLIRKGNTKASLNSTEDIMLSAGIDININHYCLG